jgi:hypothetical protein
MIKNILDAQFEAVDTRQVTNLELQNGHILKVHAIEKLFCTQWAF